jgi:hypothetical protein
LQAAVAVAQGALAAVVLAVLELLHLLAFHHLLQLQ